LSVGVTLSTPARALRRRSRPGVPHDDAPHPHRDTTRGRRRHRLRGGLDRDRPPGRGALVRLLAAGHPAGVLGPDGGAAHRAHPGRPREARHAAGDPRPPLPARGHHRLRGRARRQLQAGAVRRRAAAGCSMADMADPDDVYNAWAELEELGIAQDTLPITYMNSAASLKAFVGERGGAVCTSSNARKVLEWAFAQKKRVLFFPDQHLGRNTGAAMGIPQEQMVLWGWARPYGSMGGRTLRELQDSRIILWAGHCSVHQRFTPRQIAEARAQHPDVLVVVHPECRLETVQAADLNGSTEFIAKTVREAPAGAVIGVGT